MTTGVGAVREPPLPILPLYPLGANAVPPSSHSTPQYPYRLREKPPLARFLFVFLSQTERNRHALYRPLSRHARN